MHVWCTFGDSSPNMWRVNIVGKPNFLKFLSQNDSLGQWPLFSIPTVSHDACLVQIWWFKLKSVKNYHVDKGMLTDVCKQQQYPFSLNTLRPRQNRRHFADDMFKCIFLNENVWIPIEISLKFVPKGSINNNPSLFQIMAWRRPGDKPLSEPMMVSSLTHICVTRPQWVKGPGVNIHQ